MSSNGTKNRNSMTTKLTRLAVGVGAGLALTLMAAAPASADVKPEGGSAVQAEDEGLDATSIALGALGGITFAGAGLGVALGVQRRRDHVAPHPA
jgi:hypothetical protein